MTKLREMAEKIVHGRKPQSDLVTEVEIALRSVVEECCSIVEEMYISERIGVSTNVDGNTILEYKGPSAQEQAASAIKNRFGLGE